MKNREKYADEIIDIAVMSKLALKDGKPVPCINMRCSECGFLSANHSCGHNVREWLDSDYVAPPVDWSKIAVDTPILVRDSEIGIWRRRYFAKYEDNTVYAWQGGATSWSVYNSSSDMSNWQFAKLAESEE